MNELFAQYDETDEVIGALVAADAENNSSQQEDEDEEERVLVQLTEEILKLDNDPPLIEVQALMERSLAWSQKYLK